MMLNTKLVNLLGFLAIGVICLDLSVANDNLDETLKQALFLVELLKTDFTKVLREKNDVTANSTEDENSTCSLPLEDFNSTIAMNETGVTASGVFSTAVVSMKPTTLYTPSPSMPPGAPTIMQNMAPVAPIFVPETPPGAPMTMPNTPSVAPMMIPNILPGAPMIMTNTPPGAPVMMPNSSLGAPMMMPNTPPAAPMMMPNTPPAAPMMMPYANWNAMPMGYPQQPGPSRRNFQDENYRFPYTFNRRRMMPDYYYYDSPVKSLGNYRRFGNDPKDGLVNTPATSQAQTTTRVSSAASEATTLNVAETTAATTSLTTTTSALSTSVLPTNSANQPIAATTETANQSNVAITDFANQTILQTNSVNQTILQTNFSNQFILPTNSANQSIPATSDPAEQTVSSDQILTATENSVLSSLTSIKHLRTTKKPKLRKSKPKSMKTKRSKRVRHKNRVPPSKDIKTQLITKGNENHHNDRNHHLRQLPTTDDVEIYDNALKMENITENVENVQLAAELEKEFNDNDNRADNANGEETKITKKITTSKRTTMKLFLQGSSRMPVPFPENNAFCYFYPKNSLCGTHL